MDPNDPRLQAAVASALDQIKTTVASAVGRVADHFGTAASSAARIAERDLLLDAQGVLRRKHSAFLHAFGESLDARIERELRPHTGTRRTLDGASWETLSLVEDREVEERMFADRIAQQISHESEWELRELAAYMGALLHIGRADEDRNPLRPQVLGASVFHAIEDVCPEPALRKLLVRELGQALAQDLRGCYADILKGLAARGVQPVGLVVRTVEGPGNQLHSDSGYSTLPREDAAAPGTHPGTFGTGSGPQGLAAAYDARDSAAASSWFASSSRSAGWQRSSGSTTRGFGPSAHGAYGAPAGAPPDAELMALLRRLTFLASSRGAMDTRVGPAPGDAGPTLAGAPATGIAPQDAPALMAVNLIRAHQEELKQASHGTLDHMVIDVVGSLFDQILSDPRVPPQMARQIARLQLPVLRVALGDPSFFSSRRHPVRRFVNRIASLACAFDEFDEGPGRQFLERVRELVQEIVDGDFDQIDLYGEKLSALEGFIAQQTQADIEHNGAAASVLAGKESELRLQQRYTLHLRSELAPLQLPDYLLEFLSQVWSQALVLSVRRDGADAEATRRLRRAGRDLVMSVQPKGSPAARQKFLMQLPTLMKDLNAGLQLIGWPEAAQKAFFGKLLPSHAESLKGAPLSELDYNLLARQLDTLFNAPLPGADEPRLHDVPPLALPVLTEAVEPRFSPEEAERVGLVDESAVDWSAAPLDIDLGADLPAADEAEAAATDSTPPLDLGVDIDLSASGPDEPSQGPQLMEHVKLGFAYQMHLKDAWQKVRLGYVSPGRAFFVFTHGRKHQETISMTARMLQRMCDTGRLRAVESSYLMERATARARKQLAAMKAERARA